MGVNKIKLNNTGEVKMEFDKQALEQCKTELKILCEKYAKKYESHEANIILRQEIDESKYIIKQFEAYIKAFNANNDATTANKLNDMLNISCSNIKDIDTFKQFINVQMFFNYTFEELEQLLIENKIEHTKYNTNSSNFDEHDACNEYTELLINKLDVKKLLSLFDLEEMYKDILVLRNFVICTMRQTMM